MGGVVQVVAGVVWCGERLLLARRAPGRHLAGWWEFPGGKVEAGESREVALRRELMEEFGLVVRVGDYVGWERFVYDGGQRIDLHCYEARCEERCVAGDSHDRVAWVVPADLCEYRIAPADDFIVRWLTVPGVARTANG